MNNQQNLVGAWLVEAVTPTQGAFPALLTFSSDGTIMASESPSAFESTGHGNWIHTDDGGIAYTFIALQGNEESKQTSRIKVVGALQAAGDQGGWSGPFKVEMVDSKGQISFTDRGTFTLSKIAVEQWA
jgi:hypothetical protein